MPKRPDSSPISRSVSDREIDASNPCADELKSDRLLEQPGQGVAPVRDAKNANPALRDRPIMGLEMLSGFVRDASGRWRGGQIYSPRQGRSYPAELALADDGRLEITVRAGILSKRVVWTR